MSTFLKQFVDDIEQINTEGVKWVHPQNKSTCVSKVYPIICSCDAVAPYMLQGIQQFNGANGCSYCLNKGIVVPKGRGFTRVYPPDESVKSINRIRHDRKLSCRLYALCIVRCH
ncbi:UNVERIFIED_CONTAM: hypothetical protein FKN15_015227 [Acipenser sinensis]